MKRWIMAGLAAMVAAGATQAAEGYVGAGAGTPRSAEEYRVMLGISAREDTDPMARLFGGIWINDNFAVEVAYHDFGGRRFEAVADHGYDLDETGWSLGVLYEYGDAAWAPYSKIGYYSADLDGTELRLTGPIQISDSESGLMLEAGVRWTPSDRFSLRAGYEWFDFESGGDGSLTLAAQVSF